jgi:DnaA family protein
MAPARNSHRMKQLALDIGLATGPTLEGYFAGPNEAAVSHLQLWLGSGDTVAIHSPVPTYLWGESGCGKTHLLEAVRGTLIAQGARVGWLHPGLHDPPPFHEIWDAVVMDDVERYSAVQQHAAFNWFVNAQSLQRGVIAAGSLPPAHLALREDLRTRLGWGHVFALQVLNEEERRAVLRQAADDRGLMLTDEVLNYMLHRFSRDLASLMELLQELDGYALRTQRAITIPLIRAMLENE